MAKKKDKKDKKGFTDLLVFKLASLILSIIAVIISYLAYNDNYREDLIISTNRIDSCISSLIMSCDYKFYPSLVGIKFECKLTNSSNKSISIIDYKAFGDNAVCSNLTADMNDAKKIDLPIKIEPYDTKKVYFELMYVLDSTKIKLLKRELPFLDTVHCAEALKIQYRIIENVLNQNQADIFGNRVYKMANNSGFTIGNKELKQQIYTLRFETSMNNVFVRRIGYYPIIIE